MDDRLPTAAHATARLTPAERRQLGWALLLASAVLVGLVALGLLVERRARTPLVQVGQPAPLWDLPSSQGGRQALAGLRGRSVLLVFMPAVNCRGCRELLLALEAAQPRLQARGAQTLVITTDLPAVQRMFASLLGLSFPLLSEQPAFGEHPVGSAYGLYHRASPAAGPVDAQALIVIDAAGVVRAVQLLPGPLSAEQIDQLVAGAR